MARRSNLLAGAGVVVVLVGGGVAVVVTREKPAAVAAVAAPSLNTTTVRRTDLSDNRLFSGALGFGSVRKLKGAGAGMITKLSAVGTEFTCGTQLYRVNDEPVVVFFGDTPLFRVIDKPGMTGNDVLQLRRNLAALGFPTESAKAETSDQNLLDALKRWQEKLGVTNPGTLRPGQVVIVDGPGRINALVAEPGAPAEGPVLEVTSTTRVVTLPTTAADADSMKPGTGVTIRLSDAREIPGKVTTVSRAASAPDDTGADKPPKVTVTITPDHAEDVASVDSGSVQVRLTTAARKNVLAVPVGALVALREGGYALQRPDGSLVAATTGIFAGGLVEISGAGITEGMPVVTSA